MPHGNGYKFVKTFFAQSSNSIVTASSEFVNPQFTPNDDSIELTFSEFFTENADNTASVQLWLYSHTEDGSEMLVPYATLADITSGSTSHILPRVQVENVPAGSWHIALSGISGTTPSITGAVFMRSYRSTD